MPTQKAVVLLSGGLDSATALGIAVSQNYDVVALSFDYGQRHAREIACADALARYYKVARHETLKIDLRAFGGSALTADIDVPKDHLQADPADAPEIPVTYVPARNTIFLAFSLGLAEVSDAFDIFLGVNAVDYSGYPDCRPEFIAAFERVANLGTKAGVEALAAHASPAPHGALPAPRGFKIHAPLIRLSKADIIRTGLALNVPYHLTHSCYDPAPDGKSCGHCDSCLLRLAGFRGAGIPDPIPYAS
jgi:7-cyano-7-deazaguanine synthase